MIGRELTNMYPARSNPIGEEVLRVEGLTVEHPYIANKNLIENVSFSVKAGEVLGIAGLVGAGRSECAWHFRHAADKIGSIYIKQGKSTSTAATRRSNTELPLSAKTGKIRPQFCMGHPQEYHHLNLKASDGFYRIRQKIDKGPSISLITCALKRRNSDQGRNAVRRKSAKSGCARSLNCDPNIIILDEPTKGIDVGSKTKSITLSTTWQRQEWL